MKKDFDVLDGRGTWEGVDLLCCNVFYCNVLCCFPLTVMVCSCTLLLTGVTEEQEDLSPFSVLIR
jgi:hypothetical protein